LIAFIFVANIIGIPFTIILPDADHTLWWKSPTADPTVTLTLAGLMIVMTHYYGVQAQGLGNYVKSYFQPMWFMAPIKFIEEFTYNLTLVLPTDGTISAPEILLLLLSSLITTAGVLASVGGFIPLIVWQGFKLFISAIQAFIFVMLAIVYLSHKLSDDH